MGEFIFGLLGLVSMAVAIVHVCYGDYAKANVSCAVAIGCLAHARVCLLQRRLK